MLDDRTYAGSIKLINLDLYNNEIDRFLFRLSLRHYVNYLEDGAKLGQRSNSHKMKTLTSLLNIGIFMHIKI
jgi:hypothetical protein